jgi:GntR family transcriptional regulator
MPFTKGPIPLYFQFYLDLKRKIITGDLVPGAAIPTLNDLVEQTGISHGMIRKALELLASEGLIAKKPRLGTVVRESNKQILWVPSSSLTEVRQQLEVEKPQPITAEWVEPPNRVIKFFVDQEDVLKDGRIYKLHFLLTWKEDQRRRNLSTLFVPHWRYKQLRSADLKKEPLRTVVNHLNIIKIKQIIQPWFCDSHASDHLQLPEGTPIFHRTFIPYLEGETAFTVLEQLTTVSALERDIDIQGA